MFLHGMEYEDDEKDEQAKKERRRKKTNGQSKWVKQPRRTKNRQK